MSFVVDQSDPSNRRIVCTKKILPHELILEAQPSFSTVLATKVMSHCSYCFKKIKKPALCGGCVFRGYCDEVCQKLDWQDCHKQECKLVKAMSSNSKKTLNSLTLLILRVLLLKDLKDPNIEHKILLLTSQKEKFPEEKVTFFRETAVVLLKYMDKPLTVESIEEIVELTCKICLNSFTIYNLEEEVALGLFVPTNFINHSCEPNAHVVFAGRLQRIFALNSIEESTEITISYSQKLTSQDNRKFLKENYLFECKCPQCEGKSKIPDRVFVILESMCSDKIEFEEKIKCWIELTTYYKGLPRIYYGRALSELSLHSISTMNFKKAYTYLKQYIECCEGKNGVAETEVGWKYAELAKLAKYLAKLKDGANFGSKALEILKKYYKTSDKITELEELEINVREMQDLVRANEFYR